jgi:hypothetical protein
MIQCHLYASLVSDILYSTLFSIRIYQQVETCVYYNICMEDDLNPSLLALQGSVGRRVCPPDLLCQHRQGRFGFVYLSPQKHLGGNAIPGSFTRRRDMGSSVGQGWTVLCGMAFCVE